MRQEQRLANIGYARVSTTDQNPQLQLDALQEAGATRIVTDHGVSGATASRPHLDACLDHLREGDVLTVWKLDRRGRNKQHVLTVVDQLTSRGSDSAASPKACTPTGRWAKPCISRSPSTPIWSGSIFG